MLNQVPPPRTRDLDVIAAAITSACFKTTSSGGGTAADAGGVAIAAIYPAKYENSA